MADIISSFPDSILCYILSLLPTKEVVATSVISKRWNLLWRSVPSMDFDFELQKKGDGSNLLLSMNSFLRGRYIDQSLLTLRLRYCYFREHSSIEICIEDVLRRSGKLEHLELKLGFLAAVPSVVFSCKTLVVLKLTLVALKNISFFGLPLLKILHLNSIDLSECIGLFQLFLSECRNLEDLEVNNPVCPVCLSWKSNNLEEFHTLPKLVRAKIDTVVVPLEIVKNIQVLVTNRICKEILVCDFQNLVELDFAPLVSSEGWLHVLEVFRRCPKLQTLFIQFYGDLEAVLPYPLTVPTCISLHLKTCCFEWYMGCAFEFQFAEYIMLNANYLRTMKFRIPSDEYDNLLRRHDMIRDLSSCCKSSDMLVPFHLKIAEKLMFDFYICECLSS